MARQATTQHVIFTFEVVLSVAALLPERIGGNNEKHN